MLHFVGLGGSLFCFWLLMSGHYGPLLLTLGICSVVFVLYLTRRMDYFDRDTFKFSLTGSYFTYWSWLAKEIFKANLEVTRIILSPTMKISPRMVRVKSTQTSELGIVIFANSITLTPGTVSVDIEGDEIIVHALSDKLAMGVLDPEMDKKVTALEKN
jgi:multicomponent Na+:H+ antiporter subunit E